MNINIDKVKNKGNSDSMESWSLQNDRLLRTGAYGAEHNFERGFKSMKIISVLKSLSSNYEIAECYTEENARLWNEWYLKYSGLEVDYYQNWISPTGVISALFYPRSISPQRLELPTKFFIAFFNNDDVTECSEQIGLKYYNEMIDMLDKIEGKDNISMIKWSQYSSGIYIIMDSICQNYSLNQRKRFCFAVKRCLTGSLLEYKWKKRNSGYKNFQEYVNIRYKSIGMLFSCQLIELTQDIEIKDSEWYTEYFEKMYDSMVCQNTLINDLASLKKELNETDYDLENTLNGVVAVMKEENLDLNDAIDKVGEIIKNEQVKMKGYQEHILKSDSCSEEMKIYIECFNLMTEGNIYASIYSQRYLRSYDEKERVNSDDVKFVEI